MFTSSISAQPILFWEVMRGMVKDQAAACHAAGYAGSVQHHQTTYMTSCQLGLPRQAYVTLSHNPPVLVVVIALEVCLRPLVLGFKASNFQAATVWRLLRPAGGKVATQPCLRRNWGEGLTLQWASIQLRSFSCAPSIPVAPENAGTHQSRSAKFYTRLACIAFH